MEMPEVLYRVLEIKQENGTYYGKYLDQQFASEEDAFTWLGGRYEMELVDTTERFLSNNEPLLIVKKFIDKDSILIVTNVKSLVWNISGIEREIVFK